MLEFHLRQIQLDFSLKQDSKAQLAHLQLLHPQTEARLLILELEIGYQACKMAEVIRIPLKLLESGFLRD